MQFKVWYNESYLRDLDSLIFSVKNYLSSFFGVPQIKEGNNFRPLTKEEWILLIDKSQDEEIPNIKDLKIVQYYGKEMKKHTIKEPDQRFYFFLRHSIDKFREEPINPEIFDF